MDQNVNPNANINWAFQVNLSGLRAPTGAAAQLPEGYYKATITDAYTLNDKPGRVIIKTTISEGEFTGTVRTTGLGVPKSAQDGVRYYWRGLLESAGYTPAQIDAGEVGMNRALLVGKSVTVHYVPGDKEAGIYEELVFRLGLIGILLVVLEDAMKVAKPTAMALAVAVSAVAFTIYHPLRGPDGGVQPARVVFYLAAGVYFGVLFAARGFGIAVGAHAFYDIASAIIATRHAGPE
jgi:hypothetical protein